MSHNVATCDFCTTGKSGFNFCSGNCDMSKEEVLDKLKKGEIQFLNDSHDSELFCYLTHANLKYNAFNLYYLHNDYCETPFKGIPIIKLSNII